MQIYTKINNMEETIQRLQLLADRAKKYYWKDESEVVVKLSDVRAVLKFYESANVSEYTEQELNCKGCMGPCGQCKDEPPNAPDITPEWDKIPERFIFVAIDSNGDECAYSVKPYHNYSEWRVSEQWVKTGRKIDMTIIDWTKTLSKRPAK